MENKDKTCTNIIRVYCNDLKILEEVARRIHSIFECYFTCDNRYNTRELEFGYEKSCPLQAIKDMIRNVNEESLYLQVLSYDLDNEYVAHHVYTKGIWINKMTTISYN